MENLLQLQLDLLRQLLALVLANGFAVLVIIVLAIELAIVL